MEVGHSRLILHRSLGIKFGTKQRGQCQVPTSRFCVTFDYSCYHSPIEHSAVAPSDCMILSFQCRHCQAIRLPATADRLLPCKVWYLASTN
jgi:5-methylcytosine-specific restriction endonuclease McrA